MNTLRKRVAFLVDGSDAYLFSGQRMSLLG